MTTNNNQLIKIEATAPAVSGNFEEVERALRADLEKYKSVVVTEETLAADKKLATEINKRAGEFKRLRIDKEKELSAPIREFGDKMKVLEGLCTEVVDEIKGQVKVHEQKRLDKCAAMLDEKRTELREQYGVTEFEYHMAEFDDLIKLGSLTKGDALTKGAVDAIDMRVREELQFKERTNTRLVQLENACLRAGMSEPLSRENVEAFLYQDDATYQYRLDALIESEVGRQKRIEESARLKAQTEAQESQQQTAPQESNLEPLLNQEQQQRVQAVVDKCEQQPEQTQSVEQPAHPMRTVTATFRVPVPSHVPDEAVKQKLKNMLSSAGISTLDSLEVTR